MADPEATTTYLLMAARQARAGSAHEEALENLERALSLWEEHGNLRSAELLEQRASTLRSLGRPAEAVASYRKAIDLFEANGVLAKVAEASIALSYLQAWRLDSDGANRTMERAHRLVKGHDGHLLGNVLSMRAAIMSAIGEPEIAERMFEEAKALGTSTPVPSQEPRHAGRHSLLPVIPTQKGALSLPCGRGHLPGMRRCLERVVGGVLWPVGRNVLRAAGCGRRRAAPCHAAR